MVVSTKKGNLPRSFFQYFKTPTWYHAKDHTSNPPVVQLTLMWRQTGTWDPWAQYSNTCPWTNISLSYKLQIHSMGLKTTCTVGANYRQKIKTTTKKNPIATSEELRTKTKAGCQEQKQGTVHSPYTQHHLRSGQNT